MEQHRAHVALQLHEPTGRERRQHASVGGVGRSDHAQLAEAAPHRGDQVGQGDGVRVRKPPNQRSPQRAFRLFVLDQATHERLGGLLHHACEAGRERCGVEAAHGLGGHTGVRPRRPTLARFAEVDLTGFGQHDGLASSGERSVVDATGKNERGKARSGPAQQRSIQRHACGGLPRFPERVARGSLQQLSRGAREAVSDEDSSVAVLEDPVFPRTPRRTEVLTVAAERDLPPLSLRRAGPHAAQRGAVLGGRAFARKDAHVAHPHGRFHPDPLARTRLVARLARHLAVLGSSASRSGRRTATSHQPSHHQQRGPRAAHARQLVPLGDASESIHDPAKILHVLVRRALAAVPRPHAPSPVDLRTPFGLK